MKTIILLTILCIFLAGCQFPGNNPVVVGSTPPALEGRRWVLTGLKGQPPIEGTTITAEFQEGNIGGSAGCNSYGGKFSLQGDRLKVSDLMSTEMACMEPGVMDQEAAYLSTLIEAASNGEAIVRLNGETLEILDRQNQVVLAFAPQKEVVFDPTMLNGTNWQLASMTVAGGDGTVSSTAGGTLEGSTITAAFENGQIVGSAGCNSYFASYTLDGQVIKVGPAGATKMMCEQPEGVMEQEAQYLQILEKVEKVEGAEDELRLLAADGSALIFMQVEK